MTLPTKGKSRASYALSLNHILSDLDNLPGHEESSSGQIQNSGAQIATVPSEPSDSVQDSINVSLGFITHSNSLLQESAVMESVLARLNRVDEGLQDVDTTLQAMG